MHINDFKYWVRGVLWGKDTVGVFLSGGFDSTTLLYAVAREYAHQGSGNIYILTVPRHDDSIHHSARVVSWVQEKFPEVKFITHIYGNPDLHHSQQVVSGIRTCLKKHPNLTILLGDTSVPPCLENEHAPVREGSNHPRILQPFLDNDKRFTVELCKSLGILDEVCEISHTCTESKLLRCGVCWQCRERAWAFKELNYTDTGVM